MNKNSSLTPKQQRFCDEYLISLNATDACIKAGYSLRTAKQMGTENLSKLVLREYLKTQMKLREERTGVTMDRVLTELSAIAFLNITDICNIDEDGSVTVKSLEDIPEEARAATKEVTTFQLAAGGVWPTRFNFRIRSKGWR